MDDDRVEEKSENKTIQNKQKTIIHSEVIHKIYIRVVTLCIANRKASC